MKKCIMIGSTGSGKTTLCQALTGAEIRYHKTQAVSIWEDWILDTPGEYLDRRPFQGALMLTSAEAEIVVLIQSATDVKCMFSPCYAGSFAKDVIGVVTKIDAAPERMIEEAELRLKMAGAMRIYKVSAVTGEGLDALMEELRKDEQIIPGGEASETDH